MRFFKRHVSPSASSSQEVLKLIEKICRRRRLSLLIAALGLVLAANAIRHLAGIYHSIAFECAALGIAAIDAGVLFAWILRQSRIRGIDTARLLDSRWELKACMESCWELSQRASLVVGDQANDTLQRLGTKRSPEQAVWWTSLILLIAGLALGVAALTFAPPAATDRYGQSEMRFQAVHGVESPQTRDAKNPSDQTSAPRRDPEVAAEAPPAQKLPEDNAIFIRWLHPSEVSHATPIEQVLLSAAVNAHSGVASLSLEVSINGRPAPAVMLPPEKRASVSQPGESIVEFTLLLDALGVQDHDMMSCYIQATPHSREMANPVRSDLRIIEIQTGLGPRYSETHLKDKAHAGAFADFLMLRRLQIEALQKTVCLSGSSHVSASPLFQEAAQIQDTITTKAQRVANELSARSAMAEKAGSPTKAQAARLAQVFGPLPDASAKALEQLRSEDGVAAVAQQAGVLKILAQCIDALYAQALEGRYEMLQQEIPDRALTPAGRLEALAHEQADIAARIGSLAYANTAGSQKNVSIPDDLIEQSGKIAFAVKTLVESEKLVERSNKQAAEAAPQLQTMVERLAQNDPERSLPRAAAASSLLQQAVREQELAGQASAAAALYAARKKSTESLSLPEDRRSATLNQTAKDLHQKAVEQQMKGSQVAAQKLEDIAEKLEKAASNSDDKKLLHDILVDAAEAESELSDSEVAEERLEEQISRLKASVKNPGQSFQEKNASITAMGMIVQAVAAEKRRPGRQRQVLNTLFEKINEGEVAEAWKKQILPENLDKILTQLGEFMFAAPREDRRRETVRYFALEDVDPLYRSAVENYYERVAREKEKP